MSHKSRLRAVEDRRNALERHLAAKAENPEHGKPASQRSEAPYPNREPTWLRFTRDRFGITLAFSQNRRDRRRG